MIKLTLPDGKVIEATMKLPEVDPPYPITTVTTINDGPTVEMEFAGLYTPYAKEEDGLLHPELQYSLAKYLKMFTRLPRKQKKAFKKRIWKEYLTNT